MIAFLLILFTAFSAQSSCIKISGSGSCVPDSSNGCHVENNTLCEESSTPEGCQRISCNSSCPTRGYYAPYGNLAAWNAFKTNKPSTMNVSACCSVQDYYRDNDGDGFGSPTVVFSSCTGTSGYTVQTGDCCDNDSDAYPGQTGTFSSPRSCGGYDYNCDGSETQFGASFIRRGSLLGNQSSWTGWTSSNFCTGAMTGNLGSIWSYNVATGSGGGPLPPVVCGGTYASCQINGLPISGGSMMFSGTCYPDNASLYCSSTTSNTTRTVSCR